MNLFWNTWCVMMSWCRKFASSNQSSTTEWSIRSGSFQNNLIIFFSIELNMQKDHYECEYYCPRCEGTWIRTHIKRGQLANCPNCGNQRHPFRMTVWTFSQSHIFIQQKPNVIQSLNFVFAPWFRFLPSHRGQRWKRGPNDLECPLQI